MDITYDTDHEVLDLNTESEADATDSNDSEAESGSDSNSDAGTYSVVSDTEEDAYDYLYEGPKRKAGTLLKSAANKRQKTNAEKNAEADAGNGSFVSGGGRKKNAEADGTNARLGGLCLEDDRDDEEVLSNVKPEPVFKKEGKAKQERKGPAPTVEVGKKRGFDERDSAYSSEEEGSDEDNIVVQHTKKPRVAKVFEGVRARWHGLSGGKKVVTAGQKKVKDGR